MFNNSIDFTTIFENDECFKAMELIMEGFTFKNESNSFHYAKGSIISNGVEINIKFMRFHSERYNPETEEFYRGTQYYARVQIHKWVYDGDDIEYENTFDVAVPLDKIKDTINTLIAM